ncbi:ABC-2 type transport system ATP-binding protein [Leucobacter luti]|uniref:ABC transporter ATP-binding protein n=1 Tax=Leucobacter luti TaxID=340320 RepID=UPI001044010A|nr:ABC transporter ATP-binding protein [Leucobacter luti]MCW2289515.1 ABC-2 type transport system ATP-binding protein [Leucobacter luti]TCK33874.1 ABC-2 type transport system ATP-binding protein [Leucobacter luti]
MTTTAIQTRGLTRRYSGGIALDDVTLDIQANVITGLLGRNGAGKTTLMALITAQDRPGSGTIRVAGHEPFENAAAIEQMCFVRDNQRYPDDYKLKHAIRAAAVFYPNWSQEVADRLIARFRIPTKPVVKKFSRGQLSALGIVLGLASRAPITFFDEPYLGLDATARGVFYDELLHDYAEHPRTIVLSTHLIDEMDRLLERVIILEQGRVVQHADVEALRGGAHQIAGKAGALEQYLDGRDVLSRRGLGGLASAVVNGAPAAADRTLAAELGLEMSSVSLQELVAAYGFDHAAAEASESVSQERRAA